MIIDPDGPRTSGFVVEADCEPAPPVTPPAPVALADKPTSAASPVAPEPEKQKAAEEPARDASKDVQGVEKTEKKAENKVAENRAEDRKELDQVATAPPPVAPAPLPSPAPLVSPAPATPTPAPPSSARVGEAMHSPVQQMQRKASGPRQQQAQQTTQQKTGVAGGAVSAATLAALPPFGFHYSVETKGHLVPIPAADGYLTVKSNDGSTLFPRKRVATGIIIDIAVPDDATSVSISFAASALQLSTPTPAIRTEQEGTVEGPSRVAVEIKINHPF